MQVLWFSIYSADKILILLKYSCMEDHWEEQFPFMQQVPFKIRSSVVLSLRIHSQAFLICLIFYLAHLNFSRSIY